MSVCSVRFAVGMVLGFVILRIGLDVCGDVRFRVLDDFVVCTISVLW